MYTALVYVVCINIDIHLKEHRIHAYQRIHHNFIYMCFQSIHLLFLYIYIYLCVYESINIARILVYPGAFNMVTGPAHWELLQRSRAVDNQVYVISCSPARNNDGGGGYVAWGHSSIVNPWGEYYEDR